MLSWNIFHGRTVPPAGRPLAAEYASTLSEWEWDVALLQEVPPWWPVPLGRACRAGARMALTSRNVLFPVRRAIASRCPDLLRANGGGSNALLVRGAPILEHRARTLTWWPERRVVHGVRLADGWVVNLHASTRPPERNLADLELAFATARAWAGDAPLVFGGDLNAVRPAFPGMRHVARHHVDHVFADAWVATGRWELLDAGGLSDHRPVRVALRRAP